MSFFERDLDPRLSVHGKTFINHEEREMLYHRCAHAVLVSNVTLASVSYDDTGIVCDEKLLGLVWPSNDSQLYNTRITHVIVQLFVETAGNI